MKKSEVYHLAQIAVLNSSDISAEDKIDALRELFEKEDVALYCEREKEKENG